MNSIAHDQLPDGWVQQYDERTQHPFWVDTKARPPRAIWVHPYEDEQFLDEHPDVRDTLGNNQSIPNERPPPYTPRRHSYSGSAGPSISRTDDLRNATSQPATPNPERGPHSHKHRGFFGKLKDKAIGTKEEREAAKRQEAIMTQQLEEQRRQQRQQRQQRMSAPYNIGSSGQYGQSFYGPPVGNPYGSSYSGFGRRTGGGFGGGGLALPLLGGVAGGLLLGDLMGGGFGGGGFDGGGFGGGGFDGGGFGNNDFGGGGFF